MLVYRVCSKKEIDLIFLNHSLENIGSIFENKPKKSTHNYIPNILYMHFFLNKIDIINICSSEGYFICTYNIPENILIQHEGFGIYLDMIFLRDLRNIKEFAVPSELIDFDYLIKVDKIENCIYFEDYLDDPTLNDYTKNIYTKENSLNLSRKNNLS